MKCYIPHYKPERLYMFKEAPREGHGFPPNILCGLGDSGKEGLGTISSGGALYMGSRGVLDAFSSPASIEVSPGKNSCHSIAVCYLRIGGLGAALAP